MKTDLRKITLSRGEIIPLCFDYVFTAVFNNPDNIIILENFLAIYFDVPLNEIKGNVEILPRELSLESKKTANKQIDLLIKLKGELINIELSNKINQDIIDRNIIFASNTHSRNLKYGNKNYSGINKTIQINLVNYPINEELKERYFFRNEKGKILSEKFEIDYLDMVIGKKLCYTKENKLARWCNVFLSRTEKELRESLGDDLMENEAKDKVIDEVNKYSMDEEVIQIYTELSKQEMERNTFIEEARREGLKRGIEEGLEQGIKQGIEQGIEQGIQQGIIEGSKKEKIEIAKNLLKLGMNKENISFATNLSIEELDNL